MKNSIVPAVVCCLIFAAYVAGQNQPKEKTIEPCCCKHQQQMADDLHWIRETFSKPYVAPELPPFTDPGPPNDPGNIEVPKFGVPDIEKTNFGTPKKPKSR